MAFLLADAAKLTQNMLVRGVIEMVITESNVLKYLPFVTVNGSGITYNRELTLGSIQWHAVNDVWVQSELTVEQKTAALAILGGDADVDSFLQQTYSNRNDIRAEVVAAKAKALAYTFNAAFFYGDSGGGTNQFDGLSVQCGAINTAMAYSATVRAASNGANGAVLDLDTLDTFIDAIKPGKPDVLFMSKRTRRKLKSLKRAAGGCVVESLEMFGRRIDYYDGIAIEVDENIPDTETVGASGAVCSSIFGVKFGFNVGVCGLQNGGISVQNVGSLETKDAWRTRVKWYVGLATFRSWSIARLAGVK